MRSCTRKEPDTLFQDVRLLPFHFLLLFTFLADNTQNHEQSCCNHQNYNQCYNRSVISGLYTAADDFIRILGISCTVSVLISKLAFTCDGEILCADGGFSGIYPLAAIIHLFHECNFQSVVSGFRDTEACGITVAAPLIIVDQIPGGSRYIANVSADRIFIVRSISDCLKGDDGIYRVFRRISEAPDIVVGSVADDVQTLDLSALCRSAALAGTLLFAFAGSRRLNRGLPSICIGILIFDPVMAKSFKGLFIFDLAASRTLLVLLPRCRSALW